MVQKYQKAPRQFTSITITQSSYNLGEGHTIYVCGECVCARAKEQGRWTKIYKLGARTHIIRLVFIWSIPCATFVVFNVNRVELNGVEPFGVTDNTWFTSNDPNGRGQWMKKKNRVSTISFFGNWKFRDSGQTNEEWLLHSFKRTMIEFIQFLFQRIVSISSLVWKLIFSAMRMAYNVEPKNVFVQTILQQNGRCQTWKILYSI